LSSAKKKFRNEWIAFRFTNEAREEGNVLAHHRDTRLVHEKLRSHKLGKAKVYVTFAGRLLPDPKEYAVILFFSV